jgi:hypothetical protein
MKPLTIKYSAKEAVLIDYHADDPSDFFPQIFMKFLIRQPFGVTILQLDHHWFKDSGGSELHAKEMNLHEGNIIDLIRFVDPQIYKAN